MQRQVLIVEDNEINRAMLHEILSADYQVLEAKNGREALHILQQRKDSVALILLDVIMPVMDGYTFLNRIRGDAELSLIPVIAMTQGNSETDEVAALAHGATDFVPKPYRPQVILHRVASLIKLRETAAMVNQLKYDRLTGLYSKEYFYQEVRERLAQNPEREYSLICANVENFKLFNDAFGIPAGDRLLKQIADSFRTLVGEDGICGRFRADRFVFLQERNQQYKYYTGAGADSQYAGITLGDNVVMKWGIYEITDKTTSVELMCDRALLAVDSIKGHYNEYYAVYDDSHCDRLLREKAITDSMESALAGGQFVVYYQPKYSLSGDCMAGAEALVRWNHPQLGFISPGEFIPLFEENGFIPELDLYVWEQVCAALRDWKARGFPIVPIAVNVSRGDLFQTRLVEKLQGLVQTYGIDPGYLHLEITESAYSEYTDQIISTVEALRKAGFIIEMDDFGSGYSSLGMLSRIKLDILKLDMEVVRNETARPAEQSILNDIITMAHRLNLQVVAEGIGNREQVDRLRSVGCDYVQGYFFAKPMLASEFEKLLEACHIQSEEPLKAPRGAANPPCLLVADEDAAYRQKVRRSLDGRYDVLEAADGENALRAIRACGGRGVSAVILSMTLPDDGAASVMKVLRQEPAFWQIPVLATIPSGGQLDQLPLTQEADDFLCKFHSLVDLQRRIQRLIDIATFQQRESILRDEANREPVTGLLNRRGLQAATARIGKGDQPVAVCLFDLDDLKKANDTYGHETGDRMLRAFSELLLRKTRSGDILCRYGGDEFVVILKQMNSAEAALEKGRDICRAFHDFQLPDGSYATCSGGVALCDPWEAFSEEIIRRADVALYRAKHNHKGTCCLWTEDEKPALCGEEALGFLL